MAHFYCYLDPLSSPHQKKVGDGPPLIKLSGSVYACIPDNLYHGCNLLSSKLIGRLGVQHPNEEHLLGFLTLTLGMPSQELSVSFKTK